MNPYADDVPLANPSLWICHHHHHLSNRLTRFGFRIILFCVPCLFIIYIHLNVKIFFDWQARYDSILTSQPDKAIIKKKKNTPNPEKNTIYYDRRNPFNRR
jgi:hypothetical protein